LAAVETVARITPLGPAWECCTPSVRTRVLILTMKAVDTAGAAAGEELDGRCL